MKEWITVAICSACDHYPISKIYIFMYFYSLGSFLMINVLSKIAGSYRKTSMCSRMYNNTLFMLLDKYYIDLPNDVKIQTPIVLYIGKYEELI